MKSLSLVRWAIGGCVVICGVALIWLPPLSEAAAPDDISAAPMPAESSESIPSSSASIAPVAQAALSASAQSAAAATRCELGAQGIEQARQWVHYRRYEEAEQLLSVLLDDQCLDDAKDRDIARFQLAYVAHLLDRPDQVLNQLDALETSVPIDDYIHWLRGKSLRDKERFAEAADAFGAIFEADNSRLHWKARAQQSKALVAAERFDEALPIVEHLVETFPDYPRRHLAMYHHGKVLEALDRPEEAALAYQQAHFEFPHKEAGELAGQRLDALMEQGFRPPQIDPEKRFEHYRQLSIDKFWPLAHRLMTELRREVATPEGNSEFENEILQRIALNTYHRHDFEKAAEYFAKARSIYEDGHTDGFNKRTIYRFHNFALARLGRFDEAREALETLYEDSTARTRNRAIARFYERYGRYEEAYQLYDRVYTRGQKRRWHFSYLKYKTGRFEEAYDNLRRLARYSRGETRAKYLYWAARSLERAGSDDDALQLFVEIRQARPNSYYGIQSTNRIIDLEQRATVDDSLLAQAERITDSADQVFSVFDEANRSVSDAGSYNYNDPRTRPMGQGLAARSVNPLWGQDLLAAIQDDDCEIGDGCMPRGLGLPFPTYGLTWNFDQPLMDPRMGDGLHPVTTRGSWSDNPEESIDGLDHSDLPEVRLPQQEAVFTGPDVPRVRFNTAARIYWGGRHGSDVEFVNYERGEMLGPSPSQWTAYDDDTHHGGIHRATEEAGDLFPSLQRARWLWLAGWYTEARREIRSVALEFRALSNRSRARNSPHRLSHGRWAYHIDNRRRSQRADYWGMNDDELRFPVPDDADERQALLERQQAIYDQRNELEPLLVNALQEVGDYHMVRQYALSDTWWLREEPSGEAHRYWKMAYPRAFPEQVIPLAEKHNVNPYMIWALMLVESSFNPDSISVADALGLLQVIPRTGHKIADLFGSEDFGPFDLLEADNSIEQGIFYFAKLVRKFHGQELFAFAGYNGGPHRVSGWLDMRGQNIPLDEFVEEIPFDESRGYAKKVLRFVHVYLRLYEDYDDGLYVGQNVRSDYLEQPNF